MCLVIRFILYRAPCVLRLCRVSQIENFVSPGQGPPVDGRYNCYFFNANGDRVTVAYQLEGCPDAISTQAEKTRSQQFTKHKPPLKGEDPLHAYIRNTHVIP